jgi:LacI family transcriptional regulator
MTVSRVLRNHPKVSDTTRNKVLRAAQEANYFPPLCRQNSSAKQGLQYYILFQQDRLLKDAFFSDIILSMQKELFEAGHGCSFGVIKTEYSEFIRMLSIIQAGNTDGVLVVGDVLPEYVNILIERFPKLVMVDHPGNADITKSYNSVICDQQLGSCMAVNHLIKLRRKKILLIHGPKGHYFTKQMLAGYMETLLDNDIDFDPRLTLAGDFHMKGGYDAVKHALKERIEFDAIFANDEMACGALQALHEADISVPDKVSIVGFDGLIAGEAASPPLTTIMVDRHEMGSMAVRRLLGMEEESERFSDYIKVSLFPRLVVRQSCGAEKSTSRSD